MRQPWHRDAFNAPVLEGEVRAFRIKLAHGEDGDLVLVFAQHLLKYGVCHGRFEVETVAAILHLSGVFPVAVGVILLDAVGKFGEESRRSPTGGNVGCPQAVGRKTTDIRGTFQDDRRLSLTGGCDGCGDAAGIAAYDDHIETGLGGKSQSRKQEDDACKEFLFHTHYIIR